jgi:NhaP-type Na+/H+ or K+/H+ antiporter
MMRSMSTNQVLLGVALMITLAVGAQVLADRLRIPALILWLVLGFAAGAATDVVRPDQLLGSAFTPLVDLAVALIIYDAGLGLDLRRLTGTNRQVVVRLIAVGVPLTFALTTFAAAALLDMSHSAAIMLGAILVVSGPTVVGPLLDFARPTGRARRILVWEGSLVDPIGAILGAVVYAAVVAGTKVGVLQVAEFGLHLGVGLLGGAAGLVLLWLLLQRLQLGEVLGTVAQVAVVIAVAAVCDVVREDTGLIAAVVLGLAVGNLRGFNTPARRPFFEVLVRLTLGLLFISISATVTPDSLRHLALPTLGLVAVLVIVVRPLVAALSTWHTDLDRGTRMLIGWMAPRGIVAAATAATFGATLARKGIPGAEHILPVTFLVIVATVTLYGLTAAPLARAVGAVRPARSRPLLVGGEEWVVDLARALRAAGLDVLIWSGEPNERAQMQAAGFQLASPDVVALATGRGTQIEGVTVVLLLTGENDFNALASTLLWDTVDDGVYWSAAPSQAHGVVAPYVASGVLFAPGLSAAEIRSRCATGSQIVARRAVDGVPPAQDVLFVVSSEGELRPVTTAQQAAPGPQDTVVVLAN